jgi:ABC-type Fe3+-hydroxamate transport system substrate-binding protein
LINGFFLRQFCGLQPEFVINDASAAAEVFTAEDKADKWLAEWDKKTAAAKTKVQKAVGSKTISIMQTNGKDIYVFGFANSLN